MDTISLLNKRCDKTKVNIDRMLADLVNSKEDLWRVVGALNRDLYFCLMESYIERKLREFSAVEDAIGPNKRTEDIRALIASLPPDTSSSGL